MPELLEVETYRRAALAVVGRTIEHVDAPDRWFLKGGITPEALTDVLVGTSVADVVRHGKLLMVLTDSGPVLGLRFGMTGRIVVDGEAPIGALEYSTTRSDPSWERFRLSFDGAGLLDGAGSFDGAGSLVVVDPRRLGGVELDPPVERLGVEASTVAPAQLRDALGGSRSAVKAVLLDQHRIAGLGNLLVDETLWRVGIDPARAANDLDRDEVRRLAAAIRSTVRLLRRRGGSHTGDLHESRTRGGPCPRCGSPLSRRIVGGRTTYSCPQEQA